MKFDPYSWHEVQTDGQIDAPKGRLRVQCSAPSALYIEAQGYEALAGHGTAFTLDLSEAVKWRVEGPQGVRAFVHRSASTSTVAAGEVFTNIDRMPHESGHMIEVKRALRMFELERRNALSEIRAERAALETARRQAVGPEPESDPEAEPEPDAQAEPEQKAKE